ncbi:hypothetical protein Poly24_45320 [Rosistilla carotiformis]|uniref:Uncharacterized protein n=1 Tax=Rosistilla carotiformis TaxID=2528017 RepID=A0A518JZ25_9BACT|nr:hypothetical protein [Rosistilla carotiformis]QDV70800.1 hypothetical protein Poly24_45320 [Rosistilla carotiformis]
MNAAEASPLQRLAQADALHLPGGRFTLGWPDASRAAVADRIGDSIHWIPTDVDWRRPLFTVVSSRLGRHLHRRRDWFALLRQAIASTKRESATLLISHRTAAAPWTQRGARRFDCPSVSICVSPWDEGFDAWLSRIRKHPPTDQIAISPPIDSPVANRNAPRQDAAAIFLADRIFAPHVARGGNIDRLLIQRLSDRRWNPESVWIAIDHENRPPTPLIDYGAIGWMPPHAAHVSAVDEIKVPKQNHSTLEQLLSQRDESATADRWPYLIHCTRERVGAWPDQSDEDYFDELLTGRSAPDPGPLGTLRRILQTQRLLATDRLTRGGQRVTCFSARPLPALLRSRVFRAHLGRWDYEPFGIAIRRRVLQSRGGRPVIYGDDSDFDSLESTERAFFQNRGTTHDWTAEQEWRIAGDVSLAEISANDAFVFVASSSDADRIAAYSRWPIAVVGV